MKPVSQLTESLRSQVAEGPESGEQNIRYQKYPVSCGWSLNLPLTQGKRQTMNSLLKSHVFTLSFPVILPLFHPFFVWWANGRAAGWGIERGTKNIITIILDSICFCFRTDTQKLERREQTLKEMLEFLPDIAVRAMGTERHKAGMTLLFELLQQPKLNKQVGCRYLVHLVAPL